jgi:hypothetical protein
MLKKFSLDFKAGAFKPKPLSANFAMEYRKKLAMQIKLEL